MDLLQIICLAIVQGLTEFLPISSSAHLILLPPLLSWPDQGLTFDVAAHLGTLVAVLGYFRADVIAMLQAWWRSLAGSGFCAEARLAWGVLIGTLPVGLAGLLMKDVIETHLRSPWVIAAATMIFAGLLLLADCCGTKKKTIEAMNWRSFLFIGIAQAIALIPGTSRSGITMTAGLMLGFDRSSAARFSFLLSIPVIILSSLLVCRDLLSAPQSVDWLSIGLGAFISGLCAWFCIHYFLKWIQAVGMVLFVLYRFLLGAVLIWVFI